MAAKFATHTSW